MKAIAEAFKRFESVCPEHGVQARPMIFMKKETLYCPKCGLVCEAR